MTSQPVSGDEFYIGYVDNMPRSIRRRVRTAVIVAACASALVVAMFVTASVRLPESRFEFGVATESSGLLQRVPYPVLETSGGRVWLVGKGKWGADRMLEGIADGPVTVRGSRIQRDRHRMLELHEVAARNTGSIGVRTTSALTLVAPTITLRGEIVDSKCFLGVMNPGEGAVHRDCARRCLSGGMPPMLLVRDGQHREELVVLVSADGRAKGMELAPAAGTPVTVTGRLTRDASDYILFVASWSKP